MREFSIPHSDQTTVTNNRVGARTVTATTTPAKVAPQIFQHQKTSLLRLIEYQAQAHRSSPL